MRNLPSLDAAVHTRRPCAKPSKRPPKPRTRIKAKAKPRAERAQIAAVRAACVARDGYCLVFRARLQAAKGWAIVAALDQIEAKDVCAGPSQWCHTHDRRRSKTLKQAPELRHDTRHSFMACQKHHDQYDGRQTPRLYITARTRRGADGALIFTRVP